MSRDEAKKLIVRKAELCATSHPGLGGSIILAGANFEIPDEEVDRALDFAGRFDVALHFISTESFGTAPLSHTDSMPMGMADVVTARYRVEVTRKGQPPQSNRAG